MHVNRQTAEMCKTQRGKACAAALVSYVGKPSLHTHFHAAQPPGSSPNLVLLSFYGVLIKKE